jgi:acetolactate synthase-1/2/3 large subunit
MPQTGAALLLRELERHGVEKIFTVSGSDYAAIIEEKARGVGPELVVVPHEITAVSAAIGFAFAGKPGVAAVHTLPGTANALGSIMNAFSSRVPLLLIAGRTPYTEKGHHASRNTIIQWAQEARDQGEILRQWVKWDYEVRRSEQIPAAVSRAFQIAKSEPTGPVYLVIPREVSAELAEESTTRISPYEPGPDPESVRRASDMLEKSENPIIIPWRSGRKKAWFDSLTKFADYANIPVVNYTGETVNYPASGKMALDRFDLKKADLVIVVECEVPWLPRDATTGAKVIRVDVEPNYQYIPFYGFECDLAVQSSVSGFFDALIEKVKPRDPEPVEKLRLQQQSAKEEEIRSLSGSKIIHPKFLSNEIGKLGMIVVNEYPLNPAYARFNEFGTYFGGSTSGNLGLGLGIAAGLKMSTGRDVIAAVGDGSFYFGVPESFYYLAHDNPILTAIFDNGGWLASRQAAQAVFPEGVAVAKDNFPGTEFKRYRIGATVEAFGGYFELVEKTSQVAEALQRGAEEVQKGRLAVLQFTVQRTR